MNQIPRQPWPVLDWTQWQATGETLQRFAQIVGKTRLALTPRQNHWWNVPLYVSASGLTTSVMPLPHGGLLEIEFDFLTHALNFRCSSGARESIPLHAQTVANFYQSYKRALQHLGIEVHIYTVPAECQDTVRFEMDSVHASYDAEAVSRFWQIVALADTLFKQFSTRFYGKISPVHFFWGSFDLAVTRFNGKRAPPRLGADAVQAEAYSHECISAGFWPGNGGYGQAAFYCYAAPVPDGLASHVLRGPGAFDTTLGEFLLNYDDVRRSADPSTTVLEFLQDSYSACADAAQWDRAHLDREYVDS